MLRIHTSRAMCESVLCGAFCAVRVVDMRGKSRTGFAKNVTRYLKN